jgi:hypothetical protein
MAILQDVNSMSPSEMLEAIAKLREDNARLKAAGQRKLSLKVSDKGALSLYGLGRFPVTLYRGQWERLFDEVEHIRAFIEANSDDLSVKK